MKSTTRNADGRYDYSGACAPWSDGSHGSNETFSVSVFMWVRSRSGLKKAKSVYRISGRIDKPEAVYKRADEVCDFLDQGGVLTRKSERVP